MAFSDWLERLSPPAHQAAEALGRLVYPPHCLVCGRPNREDEDRYLCRSCIGDIAFVQDPTCPRCGHELGPHLDPDQRCANCRGMPLRFDRAVAAAHHAGTARHLVLSLKFAAQKHNAYPLAKLLAARLSSADLLDQIQLIVPVPLHRSRRRSRGFNQSELLAHELANLLGLGVNARHLRRVVDTQPQTREMSLARRRANVKGAFKVSSTRPFEGKCILLVDDVLTTGATTSECAGVLKRAGAKKVYAATVTRRMLTPPQHGVEDPALTTMTDEPSPRIP